MSADAVESVAAMTEVSGTSMVTIVVTKVRISISEVMLASFVNVAVLFAVLPFSKDVELSPVGSCGAMVVVASLVDRVVSADPFVELPVVVLWADPIMDGVFVDEGAMELDESEDPETGPKVSQTKFAAAMAASLSAKPPSV